MEQNEKEKGICIFNVFLLSPILVVFWKPFLKNNFI